MIQKLSIKIDINEESSNTQSYNDLRYYFISLLPIEWGFILTYKNPPENTLIFYTNDPQSVIKGVKSLLVDHGDRFTIENTAVEEVSDDEWQKIKYEHELFDPEEFELPEDNEVYYNKEEVLALPLSVVMKKYEEVITDVTMEIGEEPVIKCAILESLKDRDSSLFGEIEAFLIEILNDHDEPPRVVSDVIKAVSYFIINGNQKDELKDGLKEYVKHVDIESESMGWTPMHTAVLYGDLALIKFLISIGAELHKDTNWNSNNIGLAANLGHFDVIEFLINEGQDVNQQDDDGETALFAATRDGNKEVIKLLIANGADTAIQNKNGEKASDFTDSEDIKLLLQ